MSVWGGGGAHVAVLNLSCCITYIHYHNYIIDSLFQFVTLHYGCKLSIHHSRMYVFLCTSVQRVLLYYWCRLVQVHATLYIWMNVHGQYIAIPSCSVRVYVCVYIRTYVCMYVSVHW